LKIFIWNSYGDNSVYAFDTPERQAALKAELITVLQNEGSELTENTSWREVFSAIEDQRASGSDSFEYGTGISTLIYKEKL
jgi:hypothetical protein